MGHFFEGRLEFLPGEGSDGNTFYFDLPLFSHGSSGFDDLQLTYRHRECSPIMRPVSIITNCETPQRGLVGDGAQLNLSPVTAPFGG